MTCPGFCVHYWSDIINKLGQKLFGYHESYFLWLYLYGSQKIFPDLFTNIQRKSIYKKILFPRYLEDFQSRNAYYANNWRVVP